MSRLWKGQFTYRYEYVFRALSKPDQFSIQNDKEAFYSDPDIRILIIGPLQSHGQLRENASMADRQPFART